jgi:ABC-type transporter Mla MlaB component
MIASKSLVLPAADRLTHDEACRLAVQATRSSAQTVIIDMTRSQDASTAAFARLVLLRRELLQSGRDVRLAGLNARAAQLFEVHRLDTILPRLAELPPALAAPKPQRRLAAERVPERGCPFAFA